MVEVRKTVESIGFAGVLSGTIFFNAGLNAILNKTSRAATLALLKTIPQSLLLEEFLLSLQLILMTLVIFLNTDLMKIALQKG